MQNGFEHFSHVLWKYNYTLFFCHAITETIIICFLGFVSTPSTDNITDIYESISGINHLPLHYDAVKLSLDELSRFISGNFKFPSEIEWHHIQALEVRKLFSNAGNLEINIGFLWAAFLRRFDLLQVFLELGAQLR